jgi:arabinofuranosyltransferase
MRHYALLAAILLLAGLGLYLGWRLFWYLTDDAYIAFRYVSNSLLGYGYVWNSPPFKPVEGYTSFLWVALLDVVWRLAGIEPPEAANAIALVFAGGTLLVTAAMLLRMRLAPALDRYRLAFLALVLLGTLSNRTFLAWTSSGLETAMFNFWLMGWVFVAVCIAPGETRWLGALAALAALMTLTRPDGLLFLAATLALIAASLLKDRRAKTFRAARLAALIPFAVTAAHLLWRRLTYGQWLPNTYAAKYVGPWPESGLRYVLSFVIEYSLWFWLALAAALALISLRRIGALPALARRWQADPLAPGLAQAVVIATLAAHFGYYTFIIGGDHFEYRVYSHLVPLLWVSFVWLLNALAMRPAWALPVTMVSLVLAQPIPWTHWAISQVYETRLESWAMRLPVAPYFPGPLRPYVAVFDTLQDWLILRAVGVRHQEHKIFIAYQLSTLPPREAGLLLRPEAEAVRIEGAVGAIGWVLPTVAIVDAHGLNDIVIAHHPVDPNGPRLMAHDRIPPEGYLECFQANTFAPINKVIVAQRTVGLDVRVPACENRAWAVTPWREGVPDANLSLAPVAARVIDNVWTADPLFVSYVPPEVAPAQPASALWAAFEQDFHDTGCVVFPAESAPDGYVFAFLPSNLRYAPQELAAIFPWAGLVDFQRTGGPRPYSLAYALPAAGSAAPAPAAPQAVDWGPASLIGYQLAAGEAEAGGLVEAMLFLRTNQPASTEQWFRLSLVQAAEPDANGPLAWDEGDPCRGMYPAPLWEPGQLVVAKSMVPVPGDLPGGEYALRVSMFDLAAGPDVPLAAAGDTLLAKVQISQP